MPHPSRPTLQALQFAVDAASGRRPGTLLLKNASVLNVFSLQIERTHVLLADALIAGIGEIFEQAEAEEVLDLGGRWLAPGLIDGHVHIESSLATPSAYAAAVLPRGVTGVVCDPHEIGNVAGVPGIEWLLAESENLPLDVWVTVPSCVPSTKLETAGATLDLSDISQLLEHERVVGVAEIMSFPDVIAADPDNLEKVRLAEAIRKSPEGHAPGLSGRDLQAYLASGIASDHEATTLEEAQEKLGCGTFVMVREGSVTRNLKALTPLLRPQHGDRLGFVTDDRLPHDLTTEGGADCLVRAAISSGVDPCYALRCGSYNVAKHYGLTRLGAVAPGYLADLIVLDDLETFQANEVFKAGRRVALKGRLSVTLPPSQADAEAVRNTVSLPPGLSEASFRLEAAGQVRCIEPVPYQVLTKALHVTPTVRGGEIVADPERDLLKLVCVERHGRTGGVGVGLVTGFGLRRGALASTVGHDHHNLLAVGANDADLLTACQHLESLGGGFVAVADGEILAELALPIAGLVTDQPLEQVGEQMAALDRAASKLGNTLPGPFMTLSFLGLAVIPELRLTDKGLVDVLKAEIATLEV